jgi:hypothetical protein
VEGRRDQDLEFYEYRVLTGDGEKVQEKDGGNGYTTMKMPQCT